MSVIRSTVPVWLVKERQRVVGGKGVARVGAVSPAGRFRVDALGCAAPSGPAVTVVLAVTSVPVRLNTTAVADAGSTVDRSNVIVPLSPTGAAAPPRPVPSRVSRTRVGLCEV